MRLREVDGGLVLVAAGRAEVASAPVIDSETPVAGATETVVFVMPPTVGG